MVEYIPPYITSQSLPQWPWFDSRDLCCMSSPLSLPPAFPLSLSPAVASKYSKKATKKRESTVMQLCEAQCCFELKDYMLTTTMLTY